MGHREDLLEGAKRCLYEKGYAHTTARDLVAASGTNLASIGYHFGSKEALLTQAMLEITSELGDRLAQAPSVDADATPAERFEALLAALVAALAQDEDRPVWVGGVEALAQAQRLPELRAQFVTAWTEARQALASLVQPPGRAADDQAARSVGSLLLVLASGLTSQWMIDPEHAPSGQDVVEGMRAILGDGAKSTENA
jgi:AcrR family transcriptional regulator